MANNKLLIVHHGALGDVVVTFPALIRLRQTFGRIDALFQGMLGQLAADLKVVDQWFALEAAAFATLYFEPVALSVKNFLRTYDSIILFSQSKQLQATIKETTGQKVDLIPPRPHVDQSIHVYRHIFANLAKHGFVEDNTLDLNWILSADKPEHDGSHRYAASHILIHPGSGSKKKNWGAANFIQTAAILEADGMRTEFILGPADDYLSESLLAAGNRKRKVHIVNDLKKLTALLKKAGGFIGNDSGVGHLAGFLGLPTLTVFGPSDPQRWRPLGRAVSVVRPDLGCRPCFEKKNGDCHPMECLTQTSPQTVVEAFYRLLDYSTNFPSCQYSLVD